MTNKDIIFLVWSNVISHCEGPTNNNLHLFFPASFQEDVDRLFSKYLHEDGTYHFAGNVVKINCTDYAI